jgi:2'-5' RNA ligase
VTHRLFVALLPPEPVADALLAATGGVEGAHWQSQAQLHLTLAFLGELGRHEANAVADALGLVRAGPLALRLTGPGAFEGRRPGQVSSLWVGVRGDGLEALSVRVRQACRAAGVHPESRRFVGHVTVARFSGGGVPAAAVRPFMERAIPALDWLATRFWLVESRMGRGGSHYEPVADYPLGATGSSADPRPR